MKAQNIVFNEPPSEPMNNNSILLSEEDRYGVVSVFQPPSGLEYIDTIFLLLSHEVRSSTGETATGEVVERESNNIKISIIELDDDTGLPDGHAIALAGSSGDPETYMTGSSTGLHTTSLSGGAASLWGNNDEGNLLTNTSPEWIAFTFESALYTGNFDPNKTYGILVSDVNFSSFVTRLYYTDSLYEPVSTVHKTFYSSPQTELEWHVFQKNQQNVQICYAFPTTEISTTTPLNHGSITSSGTGSKRNSGLGIYLYNDELTTNVYEVTNFAVTEAESPHTQKGHPLYTYESGGNWKHYSPNQLPATKSQIKNGVNADSTLSPIELRGGGFVFFYQDSWSGPIPSPYLSEQDRIGMRWTSDGYPLSSAENVVSGMLNSTYPAKPYDLYNTFLGYHTYVKEASDLTTPDRDVTTGSSSFVTQYPVKSEINKSLERIYVYQKMSTSTDTETGDDLYNFNSFEAVPWNDSKFVENIENLSIVDSKFSGGDFGLVSSYDRGTKRGTQSQDNSGFLDDFGIPITPVSSDDSKLVLDNLRLFPESDEDVTTNTVTDVRNSHIIYHRTVPNLEDDDLFSVEEQNNTIQKGGFDNDKYTDGYFNYSLLFKLDQTSNELDVNSPPHLIIQSDRSGNSDVQNLILGGACMYTSSYSRIEDRPNMDLDLGFGFVYENRTAIKDPNLAVNRPPISIGADVNSSYSGVSEPYGRGFALTIHYKDEYTDQVTGKLDSSTLVESGIPSQYLVNTNGFTDRKYLVRTIYDDTILIEGAILTYGMCNVKYLGDGEDLYVWCLNKTFTESEKDQIVDSTNGVFLVLNPFGLLFEESGDTVIPKTSGSRVVNYGDPIPLLQVDLVSDEDSQNEYSKLTISGLDISYWRLVFPEEEGSYVPNDFGDLQLPFYIIQTPNVIYTDFFDHPRELLGAAGASSGGGWLGSHPEFFSSSHQDAPGTGLYQVGYLTDELFGFNINPYDLVMADVYNNSSALLPVPDAGSGIASYGFSITLPYFDGVDSQHDWMSNLFITETIDKTSISITADDGNEDLFVIMENPAHRMRLNSNNSGTYYNYEIVEAFDPSDNPENIISNTGYTRFDGNNQAAQVHISSPNGEFKHMSFIYGIDSAQAGSSVSAKFNIIANDNNFVIDSNSPIFDLVSEIELSAADLTATNAEIGFATESIYSLDFDQALTYSDIMVIKKSGTGNFKLNNLVLFDDFSVYGKCINPQNSFENSGNSTYCEIMANGYLILDFGVPTHVSEILFEVRNSSGNIFSDTDNPLSVDILGFDRNTHDQFFDIKTNVPSQILAATIGDIDSGDSAIHSQIQTTVRYLLIRSTNSIQNFRLNRMRVRTRDTDLPLLSGTEIDYVFSDGTSKIADGVQSEFPARYRNIISPYSDRYTTFDSSGEFIEIPVGNHSISSQTSGAERAETSTPITMVSFNLSGNYSPESVFNFELYYSTGAINTTTPPNDLTWTKFKSVEAKLWSREPETGFFEVLNVDGNKIVFNNTEDQSIFANNNLSNYLIRLNTRTDTFARIRKSGVDGINPFVEIDNSLNQIDIDTGKRVYIERSNIISFPRIDAKWLKLTYKSSVPVNVFGFKAYTPVVDSSGSPIPSASLSSSGDLEWDIEIDYVLGN